MNRTEIPPRIQHVAIVAAGFSGTLQAVNLLRHGIGRVTLIERRPAFARGVAYSTGNAGHLLNVRAANMSALPDDPDHFVRWLIAVGKGRSDSFVSRMVYGDYLSSLLQRSASAAPDRLHLLRADVTGIACPGDGVELRLEGGGMVKADAAVLALGNLPPRDPPAIAGASLPADLYLSDPWRGDVARGLADDDSVIIMGTGLTMVDVVLSLEESGFRGPIRAMSRRGLIPRSHAETQRTALPEKPAHFGAGLVRAVRRRAETVGWRSAVDELRPYTQAMWLSAPFEEQRRFLRHVRPWWDVHRHRLAPPVAERLAALIESGRLTIMAGALTRCGARDGHLALSWRPRGADVEQSLTVRRMVNCTGPLGDLLRTREPLLHHLLDAGLIRPDRHRFGIDITAQAEAMGADGRANPRLFALGPMTRGAFWEIVAVPDIRQQTWTLARRLANAQWVGGEGL